MIIKEIKKNRGFVLLFAVVISSIVLAITLGVLNIALKELNFTTSAKDTNDAFFAADTGVECALYWDNGLNTAQQFPSSPSTMACAGIPIDVMSDGVGGGLFYVLGLGGSENSCATVTITKYPLATPVPYTSIVSKGYNIAYTSGGICTPIQKSVERQLEVTY